ncbi:MAG TPA: citrate/2-methylcitrate synthase [Acidimicrobiales bacterium]|nr:citrate/2-methylcitrate synthase [Acidimicrobiales bacterium]
MADDRWTTSEVAARRLGVKQETLYAYVSRGLVRSEPVPGSRRSRFLRADIERLAGRRRSGGRAGGLEVIVETDLTLLDPAGRLYYRGWDVADAVASGATFEEVAGWLWSGERSQEPFTAPPDLMAAARPVVEAMPGQSAIDQARALVVAVRAADPLRHDRRPRAVGATGRSLVATMVEALPLAAGATPPPAGSSVARRLWPRLSPRRPSAVAVRLLDATLVLLADHELAASTLAARVTASTWADPYLVVQAGLAALGGPLHGAASAGARDLIREVTSGAATPASAIGDRLRDGELVPGFGHRVYESVDPRAEILLGLLREAGRGIAAADGLVATMRARSLPFPNIDLAIAVLAEAHDMVDDAGEITFAVARTAGWLAHAAEEYQHRLRFRTRAAYTGPAPS